MNSVNDTFDPSPTHRRNRNLIKIFFCFVILLALITGAILLSLIHKHNLDSQIQFNSKQTNEAVGIFCSVTLHFPQCITSLSSSSIATNGRKKIDPDDIFSVSLILASNEVNNLASLTKSLILISTGSRSVSALQQCASLIDNSLNQLNGFLTTSADFLLFSRDFQSFGHENIRVMIQWLDGSVSDLRSCYDLLLVKDESRAVDDLRGRVRMAMIYASNSFDFLQNRDGIIARIESWNDQNSEPVVDYVDLSILCIFGPQYLVLFLLYFLLLRKY